MIDINTDSTYSIRRYLAKSVSAALLAVFRMTFGFMMLASVVRFWSKGWIEELYIKPKYFFPFYGFDFVVPPGGYAYLLFAVCGISALLVAIGLFYRVAAVALFLSFTYIELIDKTTYLNHYYFISMVCLMMIFLPAHVYFSIDAYRNRQLLAGRVPAWSIDSLKLFVCILYFFAGIAKINSDWLLEALPLKIWLRSRNDIVGIGYLFNFEWLAFLFSWAGCVYDMAIPFLLWNRRTRLWGYTVLVVFHLLTSLLFPIGMFPYVMIVTALIFFSDSFHSGVILKINALLGFDENFIHPSKSFVYTALPAFLLKILFVVFFIVQLLLPFRYLLYPGPLFWTEEGFRFSWRVMLMEKSGYARFTVMDDKGKQVEVDNSDFLTPFQEKMMTTQPDMILQYAHILRDYYARKGFHQPQVYVDSYVSLNGRAGKVMVNPLIDLAREEESFRHKTWIMLYKE